MLVEMAGDGAVSQQSMVCSHRQLQRLTADNRESAVVDDAALSTHRLHQACYQSATKCDYSSSSIQRCGGCTSPPVGAADAGRPAHVVIDALRISSDDAGCRLRSLPTSQITCRVLQPSTAVHRSPADPTSGNRKLHIPVSDSRHWRSTAAVATDLTNGDCRPHRLLTTQRLPAAYRYVDANGNT